MKVKNILLLTHLTSDNIGDQLIEICDRSLISVVMKNLGFRETEYKINSQKTEHNSIAENIANADVVLFGGSPVFNYGYQNFYKNTASIIKIAEDLQKPVVFSGIGVENYDENNSKCQLLKKELNLPCVKQITTRDGIVDLKKFTDKIPTALVSDPVVFCSTVFKNFLNNDQPKNKTIGLFVARRDLCTDNNIKFGPLEQYKLWLKIVKLLKKNGYDYRFLSTGHFSDEAFMTLMHGSGKFKKDKFVLCMNTPEQLIQEIQKCSAIIAFRLHANIIAYSLDIPSIGLIWNKKIPMFYDNIKYPERAVRVDNDKAADTIFSALEKAIAQGLGRDIDFLMSIYNTLFNVFKEIFIINKVIAPFSYQETLKLLPTYGGTTLDELLKKIKRKFNRTYRNYNKDIEKLEYLNAQKEKLIK